jgi:hypothetical protein
MCLKNAPLERLLPQCVSREPEGQVEKIRFLINELNAECVYIIDFFFGNLPFFYMFWVF